MSEKCFCHLNGLAVKDATAREEITNISNNLNIELPKKSNLLYTHYYQIINRNFDDGQYINMHFKMIRSDNRVVNSAESLKKLGKFSELVWIMNKGSRIEDGVYLCDISITEDNLMQVDVVGASASNGNITFIFPIEACYVSRNLLLEYKPE